MIRSNGTYPSQKNSCYHAGWKEKPWVLTGVGDDRTGRAIVQGKGVVNSISGNRVNSQVHEGKFEIVLYVTGRDLGPSRGAAGESGNPVILRNWWNFPSRPSHCTESTSSSSYAENSAQRDGFRLYMMRFPQKRGRCVLAKS
jgi:hypothetical protein